MRRVFWFAIHALGCVCGLGLVIYGFVAWKDAGFPMPRFEDEAVSGGGQLFLACGGLAIFGYCLFALISATRYARPDDGLDE